MNSSVEVALDANSPKGFELAHQHYKSFILNPGLADLAELYGETNLPDNVDARLAVLQAVASQWDYRQGSERQAVAWSSFIDEQPDLGVSKAVIHAANKLGLVETKPALNRTPNFLVVLGGANLAPLDRLQYGLESVDDLGHLVYLGASRKLTTEEQVVASQYAPNAKTEFDLGCGAFKAVLGAQEVSRVEVNTANDIYKTRLYEFEYKGQTKLAWALNTMRQAGQHRATTIDNFKLFADWADLANNPDDSVVAVTNAFNIYCQGLAGIQELTLPYGTTVETIGYGSARGYTYGAVLQLLQEVKAGIDAAARLRVSLRST